jgi:hypothetical protein
VDSLFFSAYHTSMSIFLICRPWKFAALGPGPFGPCVNTALDELKARITIAVTNHSEDYRWDIFTAGDGTLCVLPLDSLSACLPVCQKKILLIVDDYILSTSVIMCVFIQKLQIRALFIEDPKYTYQHFSGACCPHHQSSPIWRSSMFIPMYQLTWCLVMEHLTVLQHCYEKLRPHKRNFLVS